MEHWHRSGTALLDEIAATRTGRQDRPVTDQRIARATVDTFGETYTVEKYGTR